MQILYAHPQKDVLEGKKEVKIFKHIFEMKTKRRKKLIKPKILTTFFQYNYIISHS